MAPKDTTPDTEIEFEAVIKVYLKDVAGEAAREIKNCIVEAISKSREETGKEKVVRKVSIEEKDDTDKEAEKVIAGEEEDKQEDIKEDTK